MARSVDYEQVAPSYDRRYAENQYGGIERMLAAFVTQEDAVLEVGCGTGHWITHLRSSASHVVGLDPSAGMLRGAATNDQAAELVRGRAEALPFREASFDRLIVINALHHFNDPRLFFQEARRVLRASGRIVIVGLDPSQEASDWYIYRYFPRTLELDRMRYPSTAQIRHWLAEAGFHDCTEDVAHRIEMSLSARQYLDRGSLSKESTSQLTLLEDREFATGVEAIRTAIGEAETRGEDLQLRADLRLYASCGTART